MDLVPTLRIITATELSGLAVCPRADALRSLARMSQSDQAATRIRASTRIILQHRRERVFGEKRIPCIFPSWYSILQ
jgi:hypothetical protein